MADTRSLLRRFFSCGRPYKRPVILDFGCAVVSGRLRLGFPLAANYLVDELLSGRTWGLYAFESRDTWTIFSLDLHAQHSLQE